MSNKGRENKTTIGLRHWQALASVTITRQKLSETVTVEVIGEIRYRHYCIEGIKMRQRSCKVRRLLFLKRYCPFQHTAAVFILERKEGEIGKQRERPRESVCECGSVAPKRTRRLS